MGKKKKKLMKQINPEKSNKMIYAVGVGVLILFLVGVFFVLNEDKKRIEDPVLNIQKVLKESEEIIDVQFSKDNPGKIHVIIKKKDKDLMRFIKTKATELSDIKRKTEFEFIISIKKIENAVYSLKVKDRKIINFRSIKGTGNKG